MLSKTALRGSFSVIVKTSWTFVSSSNHQDISTMNGFFNWTMTYRRDSDFYRPYGRIVKVRDHPEGRELEEYIRRFGRENKHLARGKSKQAAWFVSHCATQVRFHSSSGNLISSSVLPSFCFLIACNCDVALSGSADMALKIKE